MSLDNRSIGQGWAIGIHDAEKRQWTATEGTACSSSTDPKGHTAQVSPDGVLQTTAVSENQEFKGNQIKPAKQLTTHPSTGISRPKRGEIRTRSKEEMFYAEGGEALAQVAPRGGRCPVPGNIPGQVGRGSEQPALVEDVPARGRGLDWMAFNGPFLPNLLYDYMNRTGQDRTDQTRLCQLEYTNHLAQLTDHFRADQKLYCPDRRGAVRSTRTAAGPEQQSWTLSPTQPRADANRRTEERKQSETETVCKGWLEYAEDQSREIDCYSGTALSSPPQASGSRPPQPCRFHRDPRSSGTRGEEAAEHNRSHRRCGDWSLRPEQDLPFCCIAHKGSDIFFSNPKERYTSSAMLDCLPIHQHVREVCQKQNKTL
ncbi:hypothetical protein QYF61_023059 [Mycteria americana]|uniref:Uncharacterized protein n=1 Tax=Mycteria americana TaxID=33587 RepID=A0AAN7P1D1_MYCAM|nr:hypothetical protein QYF61_023059 [Mycteria americana]